MKIALCYLTCVQNHLDFNFHHLVNHIKKSHQEIDLYKYVNDENINDYRVDDLRVSINNKCTQTNINFAFNTLRKKFHYYHEFTRTGSTPFKMGGMEILLMLDMYAKYGDKYDFYMFYEDDVLLNTRKNLFDNIDYNHDILFQCPRRINYRWYWYSSNSNNIKDIYLPYEGLLHIYGAKPHVLNNLLNELNKGIYAHHEALFNGFAHKYYTDMTYLSDTFNCYMVYIVDPRNPIKRIYDIIHPIKSLDDYVKYRKRNII